MRYAYPMDRPMRYVTYAHTLTIHRESGYLSVFWLGLSARRSTVIHHFVCEPASSLIFRDFNPVIQRLTDVYTFIHPRPLTESCRPCRSSPSLTFIPLSSCVSLPFSLSFHSFSFVSFFFFRTLSAWMHVYLQRELCICTDGIQRNGDNFIHSFDESDTDRGWLNISHVHAPIRHGPRTTRHACALVCCTAKFLSWKAG